jgi:hypothetical protein
MKRLIIAYFKNRLVCIENLFIYLTHEKKSSQGIYYQNCFKAVL